MICRLEKLWYCCFFDFGSHILFSCQIDFEKPVVVEEGQTIMLLAMMEVNPDDGKLWIFQQLDMRSSVTRFAAETWEDAIPMIKPHFVSERAPTMAPMASLPIQPEPVFGGCARRLNTAQRIQLRNAMLALQTDRSLPSLFYWGTIFGVLDYTILVSVEINKGIHRRYFYSAGDKSGLVFKFFELPALDEFINAQAPKASGLFQGKPGKRLPFPEEEKQLTEEDELDDLGEDEEEDSQNPIELPMFPDKPRKLLEVERLSYAVRTICAHTSLVPKGLWTMTPTAEIKPDPSFRGLNRLDAERLQSYMCFRRPAREETLRGLHGPLTQNTHDFLDHLGLPQNIEGLWSLQFNYEQSRVQLRSMLCPGAEFWLDIDSPTSFGSSYQGYGDINNSLVFMLPELR
jgi:hypothetical protein